MRSLIPAQVRLNVRKETMKKYIPLLPLLFSLTGCLNPNLCDIKGNPTTGKILNQEHVDFFANKPVMHMEEAHGTILPIGHYRQNLQKQDRGFRFVSDVSLLGGLLLEGESTAHYDESGKRKMETDQSVSVNMFCGLLFDWKLSADINERTGSYSKTYLFKSFGVAQEIGGSKYYTILWMPMKFSNQGMDLTR